MRDCIGKYLRVRVQIDVLKALRKGLRLDMGLGEEIFLLPHYEKLPYHCFNCRKLGHLFRECIKEIPKKGSSKFPYGGQHISTAIFHADRGQQLDHIIVIDIDVGAEQICAKSAETSDKGEPSNRKKKDKRKKVCDDSGTTRSLSNGKACLEAAETVAEAHIIGEAIVKVSTWKRRAHASSYIRTVVMEHVVSRKRLMLGDDNSMEEAPKKLKILSVGWFKLNCDAALDVANKLEGFGVVIRDDKGLVMAASTQNYKSLVAVEVTEAMAMLYGVHFAAEMGIGPFGIESDSSSLVFMINSRVIPRSDILDMKKMASIGTHAWSLVSLSSVSSLGTEFGPQTKIRLDSQAELDNES
ncbi:hypothetical protein ACOSQ2_018530 [Xanthoceras sorbifolium]